MDTSSDTGAVVTFTTVLVVLLLCAVGLFLQRKKPIFAIAKELISVLSRQRRQINLPETKYLDRILWFQFGRENS